MLRIDLDSDAPWGDTGTWQKRGDEAVAAALAVSPFSQLAGSSTTVSLSIRLSNNTEVQILNRDYRGKDRPTNVLSFPMMNAEEIADISDAPGPELMLGDIILAHETCASEAAAKQIDLTAHASHLIIHGALHLLGYDHVEEKQAIDMEAREVKALASLGLDDPYGV
jgi:probable rRNA maturation factor